MDTAEIQKRIDVMPAAMSAKGKRMPEATVQLTANAGGHVALCWYKNAKSFYADDRVYIPFRDLAGIPKALDDADARIATLPSPEEAKFKEFMSALGGVIDLGKSNGIEVEFLNPLRATMKKLSENAITFQRDHDLLPEGYF